MNRESERDESLGLGVFVSDSNPHPSTVEKLNEFVGF